MVLDRKKRNYKSKSESLALHFQSLPPHTGLRLFAASAAYWCVVWGLFVWVQGLGLLGFVVRRRLAGFWVLQSVWLVSS